MAFKKSILVLASMTTFNEFSYADNVPIRGLYAGFFVGGGNASSKWNSSGINQSNSSLGKKSLSLSSSQAATSPLIGAHIGYNLFYNELLYGLEVDFSSFNNFNNSVYIDGPEGAPAQLSDKIYDLGSLMIRLGYHVLDKTLIYGRGGLSLASTENTYNTSNGIPSNLGYVYGGGLEYLVTQKATIRLEGLYYDFPSASGTYYSNIYSPNESLSIKQSIVVGRLGFSYRFLE